MEGEYCPALYLYFTFSVLGKFGSLVRRCKALSLFCLKSFWDSVLFSKTMDEKYLSRGHFKVCRKQNDEPYISLMLALSAPCGVPPRGNGGWLRCSHGPCSPGQWSHGHMGSPGVTHGMSPGAQWSWCHWWWCWQHWTHPHTGLCLHLAPTPHMQPPGHPACWPRLVSAATKHTIVPPALLPTRHSYALPALISARNVFILVLTRLSDRKH